MGKLVQGSISGIDPKKTIQEKYDPLNVLLVSGNSLHE
jgi:hypothetical protein